MPFTLEKSSELGRRVHITLDAEQLESRCARRLRKLHRSTRLPGFRKGKAPLHLVRARFGSELRSEETTRLMRENLDQALAEENPDIIGSIRIIEPAPGDVNGPAYTAEYEIYPELDAARLAEVELEKTVPEPASKADLDRMLEELRQRHRRLEEVTRPAGPGDVLEIDLHIPDGAKGAEPGKHRLSVDLAETSDPEQAETRPDAWLHRELLGAHAGAWLKLRPPPETVKRSVILSTPETWSVKVLRVLAPRLPELCSELLPSLGFKETQLEEFRTQLSSNMERKAALTAQKWQWEAMLEALSKVFEFTLPEAALAAEQQLVREARPDGAPNQPGLNEKQVLEIARQRLHRQILLHKLMLHFKLSVSESEVHEAMRKIATDYKDPDAMFQSMAGDETRENYFREQLLAAKLLAAVQRIVRIRGQALDFFTLRAGPPALRETPPEPRIIGA